MRYIFFFLSTLAIGSVFAQIPADKQKANDLKREAVQLMDNGDPDRAISLLETAQRADPDNHVYLYEMGYAFYIKKDYPKAIEIFRQTTTYPDVTDQCYQMLGNAYDDNGERSKAREAYESGLKRFPSAGRLYMEYGLTYQAEKDYDKAVALWEKGIEAEPGYSSNYYRLAKLFARTNERIWAAFYGEIFMNVERGTDRTGEISRLLFEVYKQSISFSDDSSHSLKLDMTSNVINVDPKKGLKIPFGITYTLDFIVGLSPGVNAQAKREVTIGMISSARTFFIDFWFQKQKHYKQYPNILLDYQLSLNERGWLDAYTYWLLMKGNENEFVQWRDKNRDKFDAFAAWFRDHPLILDREHFFVRTQYDK
jgi:tetratricopeptide (TPR) repeat protein